MNERSSETDTRREMKRLMALESTSKVIEAGRYDHAVSTGFNRRPTRLTTYQEGHERERYATATHLSVKGVELCGKRHALI